jgi:hypothetical protein
MCAPPLSGMIRWVQRFAVAGMNDRTMGLALRPLLYDHEDDEGPQCLSSTGRGHGIHLQRCDPSDRAQGWAFRAEDRVLVHVESQQCLHLMMIPDTGDVSEEGEPQSQDGVIWFEGIRA